MTASLQHPYTSLPIAPSVSSSGDIPPAGAWLRGSFHGHCCESSGCASLPLAEGLKWYHEAGAHFQAVTDHDKVTDLTEMRRRYPDLVLLEGFEYSSCENLLFAGEHVPPLYELPLGDALRRRGEQVLAVVCHPHPNAAGPEYWTLEKLSALGTWPDGIEVFNGHYGTETALAHGRQPLGTSLWDDVLTAGHRLWGFANDDSHDPEDLGNAWNLVWAPERTAAAIVKAARSGLSYATTGLLLNAFQVQGNAQRVELATPALGRFIGPGGSVLTEAKGRIFEYELRTEAYARFEAEGQAGRIFLQPGFGD